MKRVSLFFAGMIMGIALIAQPVVDNAIIPVAVNLNSILRLNVTSGGNIEFTVNTIDQYTNGLSGTQYQTAFTVASSIDFDVSLYAEDATLIGTDNSANTMPLNNVGYTVTAAAGAGTDGVTWDLQGQTAVTAAAVEIVQSNYLGLGAGDVSQNSFIIEWELGTVGTDMNAASLLAQPLSPDRYTTNVFVVLKEHD